MTRLLRKYLPALALTLVAANAPLLAQENRYETGEVRPVDECQVIARVNGQVVLSCEVLWRVNLRIEQAGGKLPIGREQEIRDQLMQQSLMEMLDIRMIYGDFRRKAPQADMAKIQESLRETFEEKELPRLMKQVGVEDRQLLESRLAKLGTSLRDREQDFYKVIVAQQWIREGLKFKRTVDHQEMLDYYRENAEQYDFPTQARWEELMVSFSSHATKAKALEAICALGNQAFQQSKQATKASDPAFDQLAKKSSDGLTASEGGTHDWTTRGALAAERVDEALFTLPVGQMSPIVESPQGFHIVRVLERKEAGRTPFTKVQQAISKKLLDQRFNEAVSAKVATLKREARVWTVYTGEIGREEATAARPGATTR